MRSLKKILAVICVVAMLASVAIVPALAGTYDTQAATLNSLGLMTNAGLDQPSNRLQGLIFAIDAAGKQKDALAMSDADVAAALANVVDASDIPAWGQKFAAYAVKNGYTTGVGGVALPQIKFAPLAPIHATEYLVWLLKIGMGYTNGTADILNVAVANNLITVSQAAKFGSDTYTLIRDDIAGMLFTAVSTGKIADGTKFIDSLIAKGAVTQEAAVAAGLYTVAPTKLAVSSVTAITLTRVVVTFNKAVDKDSIANGDFAVDNTDVSKDDVSLSDDKTVATLKVAAMSNGDEIGIKISGINDASGTAMTDYEGVFTPMDSQQPTVKSIEFTGPESAKITFSEPIDETGTPEVVIDGGIYSASPLAGYGDSAEVTVNLGTELDEGAHTFKVKGFVDFAGYSNLIVTQNVNYAAVKTAPVPTIKEATQSYVILKFNRPVTGFDVADFYQSYTTWQPLEIQNEAGDAALTGDPVDTVRLVFTVAETLDPADVAWDDVIDRPLPIGTVKVVVKDEAVADNWDNKIDGDVALTATVTADTTAPTITKVTVESEKEVRLYFSKDVVTADAEKEANYVVKDKDGKVVSSTKWGLDYNTTDKYVAINFTTNLDNGNYTVTAEAVKDTTISANSLATVTLPFTITDKSVALTDVTAAWVDGIKVLYVKYTDTMATSGTGSVLNKDNYRIDGDKLGDSVKLTMFTSKIVKMQFASDADSLDGSTLTIGVVSDAAGNIVSDLSTDVDIADEVAPEITAVKKIAENKFELTIDQELKSIGSGAITVNADGADDPLNASYKFVNDGDNTKITVTVPSDEKDLGTLAANALYTITLVEGVPASGESKITSVTGVKMASDSFTPADFVDGFSDGVAPAFAKDANDDKVVYAYAATGTLVDHFIVMYSEPISPDSVSKYTYAVDGYKVTSAVVVDDVDMDAVRTAIDGGAAGIAAIAGEGQFVVITVDKLDDGTVDDTDGTPAVTQKLSVEDLAGNALAAQDAIDAISAADADTLNPASL